MGSAIKREVLSKYNPPSSVSSVVLTKVPLSNPCMQVTITIINPPAYVRFSSVPFTFTYSSHISHSHFHSSLCFTSILFVSLCLSTTRSIHGHICPSPFHLF